MPTHEGFEFLPVRMGGTHQDGQARSMLADPFQDVEAGGFRHHEIRDQEIEGGALQFEKRPAAVLGIDQCVSLGPEDLIDEDQDGGAIVDDQDSGHGLSFSGLYRLREPWNSAEPRCVVPEAGETRWGLLRAP